MLASQLPLPNAFLWQTLSIQALLVLLYQPALAVWNTLLLLLLLIWSGSRVIMLRAPFNNKQLNALLAPLLLILLLQVRQLGVLNLMLHVLLLAAIARSFSLTKRDSAVQLVWVQHFAIGCTFIFYQQVSMAIVVFTLLLCNLYLQHRLFAPVTRAFSLKRVAVPLAAALPIWLGLFVLFPRLPPLWQMPNQQLATTGLTDNLDPGSIEQLVQSEEMAFRVSFQGIRPAREHWYWRAKIYEDFDGRSWQVNERFASRRPTMYPAARRSTAAIVPGSMEHISYQVLAEPSYQHDLFSLGVPLTWSDNVVSKPAATVANTTPVAQRMSYQLTSLLTAVPLASVAERELNLRQHRANPLSRELGEQFAIQHQRNPAAVVNALASFFQQQPFYYSLTPPRLGNDAMDQFLFEHRIGFCSHYAAASVVVLRAAGIPARVVGGYQGGEWQQSQNYLLVRQREAHAWVEYLVGEQWQRFDPTAVIAPDRILSGLEQTLSTQDRALLSGWQSNWLGQLGLQWTHLDYLWSVWVLGFNQREQQQLWQQLSAWLRSINGSYTYFVIPLFMLISMAFGWTRLRYRLTAKKSPHQKRLATLRSMLFQALAGQPAQGETVEHWLTRLAKDNPSHVDLLRTLNSLYERSVFADDLHAVTTLRQQLTAQRDTLRTLTTLPK